MTRINPIATVVMSSDVGGGKCVIECQAPRGTITIEVGADSPFVEAIPEGSVVTFTLDVVPPRTNGPDQVMTVTRGGVSGPAPETPAPSPVPAPLGAVEQAPYEPGVIPSALFQTKPEDIPAPTITPDHPAVPGKGLANKGIDEVKELLGL